MKKIIINGRFLGHKITGVERYARENVYELDKLITSGEVIMAVPPEIDDIPLYQNIQVKKIGKLHNRMWEQISFPLYVWKNKGISLNLCNAAPVFSPGIVCIHDMKIKAHPEYFSIKFLLWYRFLFFMLTRHAKQILTVSQFSKNEIMKYYHVNENRIHVVQNAWQHYCRVNFDENVFEKYGLSQGEYFFSMCSLEPNKNLKWIAEAAKRYPEQLFAVAGSVNEVIFQNGLGFECPQNMKLLHYVGDEEAKTLMRDCKAFLFPTIYEGFGIPPLEAISAGCKCVVVSDTEVMHEIFGEDVIYIDPHKNEVDLSKILNYQPHEKKVMEHFSWKKSAEKLLKILKEV